MAMLRPFFVLLGGLGSLLCVYFVVLSFVASEQVIDRHAALLSRLVSSHDNNNDNSDNKPYAFQSIVWQNERDEELTLKYNNISRWGSYRPGHYFGLKTSLPAEAAALSTGLLWADSARRTFRHAAQQGELSRLEWTRHDGRAFGRQRLQDDALSLSLSTSFLLPQRAPHLSWLQRIAASPRSRGAVQSNEQASPFFVYFGADCADQNSLSLCLENTRFSRLQLLSLDTQNSEEKALRAVGHSELSGWFALTVIARSTHAHTLSLSVASAGRTDVHRGAQRLIDESRDAANTNTQRRTGRRSEAAIFDEFGELRNEVEDEMNFLAVQAIADDNNLELFLSLHEHLPANSAEEAFSAVSALPSKLSSFAEMSELWQQQESHFERAFEERFAKLFAKTALESAATTSTEENEMESVKVALSSLLGGMGVFEGVPRIAFAADAELDLRDFVSLQRDIARSEAKRTRLFTSTPSRTVFPRGFLWDEGFHQLVVSQWDVDLTLRSLGDWLNTMYTSPLPDGASAEDRMGWIPREMILGDDALRRVPDEFVVQRATIANPPTLLLVVESLLRRIASASCATESTCSSEGNPSDQEVMKIAEFVRDIYPRLHMWVQWFRYSQQGEVAGSFRWRGRSLNDNKVIPNTLASGLDDYPRAIVPSAAEKHLDLLCWMIKAGEVMSSVEDVLSTFGESFIPESTRAIMHKSSYRSFTELWKHQLDELHWSEQRQGYFDVGLVNESAVFAQAVMFRCASVEPAQPSTTDIFVPIALLQSRSNVRFCPESHLKPLYPLGDGHGGYLTREVILADSVSFDFVPRVGYVSVFPLLLKLLPPSSPRLGAVLDMVEDPEILFTPYGLRSISTTDIYYQRRNAAGDAPYWRGPIWININYLALSALKHYSLQEGPFQSRSASLYSKLRKGVLSNILKEHKRTGFFWEQYDDMTGQGMRGHPFTGWTATVVNIFLEKY